MTQNEFKAWLTVTDASKTTWTVDTVTLHNRGTYLIYRGGEAGQYVEIDETGKLQLGEYFGAMPHIGEAVFRTTFTRQFANQQAALQRCFEVGGKDFLLDMLLGGGQS